MAKTLSDARVGVRTLLDESTEADFLDAELTRAINYAYQDVAGEVMTVYEDYFNTLNPFTYAMVANQQEYRLDQSIIKPTRVEINYAPGLPNSQPSKALPIRMNEVQINLGNMTTLNGVSNAGYYIHGKVSAQNIGFVPVPNISDTNPTKSIAVWGIALPTDLSQETDIVDIPYADRFCYLVELLAASRLLSKGQQEETASSKYKALYDAGIKKMKDFLSERQADGVRMVEDSKMDNLDFQFPM